MIRHFVILPSAANPFQRLAVGISLDSLADPHLSATRNLHSLLGRFRSADRGFVARKAGGDAGNRWRG